MSLIACSASPVILPRPDCPWAQTMVLNPAIIRAPHSQRLHMLFRATGPWPQSRRDGCPMPYPIFLGYAVSDDEGKTWHADFSRPALAPVLAEEPDQLFVTNRAGERVINFANGCIEDPRLHWIEDTLYLTVACRMFPPGPYWEHDDPMQCAPSWARGAPTSFGRAARENLTVTVLFEVSLHQLQQHNYAKAFKYVAALTDPEQSDNRDAFLFPRRLKIDGRLQYVLVHRPRNPRAFMAAAPATPSMFLATAERLEDFATPRAVHRLLAGPIFPWEGNRIGGSWPPIPLNDDEWLLGYHGKQDDCVGYTQSFMILRQTADQFPQIVHRSPSRLMYARQSWEFSTRFRIPCLFSCGAVHVGDNLIMSYGAGDEKIGMAWAGMLDLVAYVRRFDASGN